LVFVRKIIIKNRKEECIEKRRMRIAEPDSNEHTFRPAKVHKTKAEVVRWRSLIALSMELGGSDEINRAKRERPVQEDRTLNKNPASRTIDFVSNEGDAKVIDA
jgi:hypothetical protein